MVFYWVILCCRVLSHLVHAPSCRCPTAPLGPLLGVDGVPPCPWFCPPGSLGRNQSLCLRHDTGTSTAFSILHFLSVLTSMPVHDILQSLESLYCRASYVHATINSSVRSLNGSCWVLHVPYSTALVRLHESSSYFWRKTLIFLTRDYMHLMISNESIQNSS